MRWEGNRESENVDDQRASSGRGGFGLGGRSIGIGTIVIALVGGAIFGINPLTLLEILSGGTPRTWYPGRIFLGAERLGFCPLS